VTLDIKMFDEEQRLQILRAVQAEKKDEVEQLLLQTPSLIQAQSKTAGQSLLHVAVQTGNTELCKFLLDSGHETAPTDKRGETPYQIAKKPCIKNLIACAHTKVLCDKLYTVSKRTIPQKSFIVDIEREITTAPNAIFFNRVAHLNTDSDNFGVTAISPMDNKKYKLWTLFREEAIMIPYYGELLVVHENEQANQILDLIAGSADASAVNQGMNINLFETRSYLKGISYILNRYPFLEGYPLESDHPNISFAKKLIISFAFNGVKMYHRKCTNAELPILATVPDYKKIAALINQMAIPRNAQCNTAMLQEMRELFKRDNSSNSSSDMLSLSCKK